MIAASHKQIGRRIRDLRKAKGLSQTELGKRAGGLSHQSISGCETGNVHSKVETLERLAKALDVTFEDLTSEELTPEDQLDIGALLQLNKSVSEDLIRARREDDEPAERELYAQLWRITQALNRKGPFTEGSSSRRRREHLRAQEAPAKDAEKQASTG